MVHELSNSANANSGVRIIPLRGQTAMDMPRDEHSSHSPTMRAAILVERARNLAKRRALHDSRSPLGVTLRYFTATSVGVGVPTDESTLVTRGRDRSPPE